MDKFPLFYSDAEATCFSCDAPTTNARKSDYAKGRGARVADCTKCNMSTWFDTTQVDAAERKQVLGDVLRLLHGNWTNDGEG